LDCGAGGLLKFSDDIKFKWKMRIGRGSNSKGELIGLWVTLFLAYRVGLQSIHMLGDSRFILDWFKGVANLNIAGMRRIRHLDTHFSVIYADHVYREHNMVVDQLSKEELSSSDGLLI
jgi:hypothetical protein